MTIHRVFATGKSGLIGSRLPESVEDLGVRIGEELVFSRDGILGPDASVIHLAARVGHIGTEMATSAWDTNVLGAQRLAEACFEAGVAKFVYVSSSHVYGASAHALDENSPVNPTSDYGDQKAEAELRVMEVFATRPQDLLIVRVFSVLDLGMARATLGGRIERVFIERSGEHLGASDDVRDFLTPATIANALNEIAHLGALSGIVNVCSGNGIKIAEAARLMLSGSNSFDPALVDSGTSTVPSIVGKNDLLRAHLPGLDLSWAYSGTNR